MLILDVKGGYFTLQFKYDPEIVAKMKYIFGAKWDSKLRLWKFPLQRDTYETLKEMFPEMIETDAVEKAREQFKLLDEIQMYKQAKKLEQPKGIKTKLWLHQLRGYHFFKYLDYGGIFMEMGTGKTLLALSIMADKPVRRILVVCPKAVKQVWRKEILKHIEHPYFVVVLEGSTEKKLATVKKYWSINHDKIVFVNNYESMWRRPLGDFFLSNPPDMIIADESHKIKAHNSKQSKYLYQLGKSVKYKYLLTGTPSPQGPLDYYGQFRFLNSNIFGASWSKFKNHFAIEQQIPNGIKIVTGYKNLDELNRKVYQISYRVRTTDVLDLPKLIESVMPVELDNKTKKIYQQMSEGFFAILEDETVAVNHKLTQLLKLQQITNGFILDENHKAKQISKEKLDALMEILDDVGEKEKVVVFTNFKHDVEIIKKELEKKKITYAEITGSKNTMTDFTEGDARVCIVNIRSGGAGIDLTVSRYAVYYGLNYSLELFEQSKARVYRHGQNKTTYIYYLLGKDTIDEKIYKALNKKMSLNEMLETMRKEAQL